MKRIREYLYYAYLAAMLMMSILLFVKRSEAASVRTVKIVDCKPVVVTLAYGLNTTLTFMSRPDTVVPGSPGALYVGFVRNDLNIRPLGGIPGDLTVYTKTARIKILFKIGNQSSYDGSVLVVPVFPSKKILKSKK